MVTDTIHNFAKGQIRTALKRGKCNAIQRGQLVKLTGLDDRTNRILINELRNEGMIIISNSSGAGYYLPSKLSEAEHFVNEMDKRARRCFESTKTAREWLRNNHDQLELDL